ncbi:MAG: peptide deformylase [Parcubacteria group bacterium]|nr:peptide deformylase [Parcubacteria group bacterium]
MVAILQKENAKLREISKPVPLGDIGNKKITKTIKDMRDAMHKEDDAVAIAAPQIGVPLRIFVVSGKMFTEPEEREDEGRIRAHDKVFINPEVKKRSRKQQEIEEGCLSVRWKYGFVKRADKITVEAYDEKGVRFTRGASGLLAQIFQHEIDHLDGTLFIDKARDVRDLPPQEDKN